MLRKPFNEFSSWLAKPPYDGVIWLAWLYVVAVCLYAGGGPFAGDLVWFDDRVRLVQILNWLNGQDWYDRTITHVNAPEGFHTIWSRVVDLPVAGIIAAFQGFVGQMHAAMIAAILVPLVQTLLLFFASSYFVEPLIGKKQTKLVTLFVLFSSCISPESFTLAGFHVGMIGHHSWYVLLTLLLFGAMARIVVGGSKRDIAYGGIAIGGLLVIGIEALPLIAGACGFIALIGWWHNREGLVFDALRLTGLGAVLGFLLLPANQPPEKLLVVSFAEPSILGPTLILTAALFFAGEWLILKYLGKKKILSLGLIAILAASIVGLLIYFFPQFLDGGAAALSPEERKLAEAEHTEAQSLLKASYDTMDYLRMAVPPFLASLLALYKIWKAPNDKLRGLYIFHLGLLLITFGMASIYSRYFHYAELTTIPWFLLLWLSGVKYFARDEFFALKSFLLYVAVGPLWLWLVPAANYNFGFGTQVLMFPARLQLEPPRCDTRGFIDFLNLRYGADKNIIVPMYTSDRFLLHSHLHIFFLANFPSQNKFMDAKTFYETFSEDQAHDIVVKNGIDLVAFCPKSPSYALQTKLTHQLIGNRTRFAQRLITGQVPPWLKQIDIAAQTPWYLYEVQKGK
jgi:hypothetical protein